MTGKYLIAINSGLIEEHITIDGDLLRPFMIAGNLWNYLAPWAASRKLESLAKIWESNGLDVSRNYGTVYDMARCGNKYNVRQTLADFATERR